MSISTGQRTSRLAPQLRQILVADGVLCAAMGLLLIALAGSVDGTLGIPESFLSWTGIVLMPWAVFILFMASRPDISRPGAWLIAGGNVLWAVASAILLLSDVLSPATIGTLFVIAQAGIVLGVADLQVMALRRTARDE